MYRFTVRVCLLFNVLGSALLVMYCLFFTIGSISFGEMIFLLLGGIFMSAIATIPFMICFGYLALALYRRRGLHTARLSGSSYSAVCLPVTFMIASAFFRLSG